MNTKTLRPVLSLCSPILFFMMTATEIAYKYIDLSSLHAGKSAGESLTSNSKEPKSLCARGTAHWNDHVHVFTQVFDVIDFYSVVKKLNTPKFYREV